MKRLFVIQEHRANRAGLHWDIRFESFGELETYDNKRPETNEPKGSTEKRVLRSFVIPKHHLPERGERLLVIPTEDHPWEYQNFEGKIEQGYGKGDVKLLFCGEVDVVDFMPNKVKFVYEDILYVLYKAGRMWLAARKVL